MQVGGLPVTKGLNPLGQLVKRELALVFKNYLPHLVRGGFLPRKSAQGLRAPAFFVLLDACRLQLAHDRRHELSGNVSQNLLNAS